MSKSSIHSMNVRRESAPIQCRIGDWIVKRRFLIRIGQAMALSNVTIIALTGQVFTHSSQALQRSESNSTCI